MKAAAIRAVAFDLDGTLVDSRQDLAEAVNRMLADLGRPPLPVAAVVTMVGGGARLLVRRALGGEVDERSLDRAVELFLARYEPICTATTRPYPGVPRLLAEQARARRLAVLTNKPERLSRRILERFGWQGLIEVVVGGDTLATRKPDPAGLLEIAARFGLEPAGVLLVGDSAIDAATAAGAGSPFVFVAWGFAKPEERTAVVAAWRAADPEALRRWLAAERQ